MFIDCVLMNGRGANDHAMHFDLGANVLHLFSVGGAHVLLCQLLGGQMSSYAIFHRGAHVQGGKCPKLPMKMK